MTTRLHHDPAASESPLTCAPASIGQVLVESQRSVQPALRKAIERLDPANRWLATYHLGWIDRHGRPCQATGKGIRAALAMMSVRAVDAAGSLGVPGAVAVELVHNFSLLHDDVMDGDTRRRGRATVWSLHGVPSAVLLGDALLGLSLEVLLDDPTPARAAAAGLVTAATRELIEGQSRDMAFEHRRKVSLDDTVAMVSGKTGALLAASAAIGAVLAEAPSVAVRALSIYGTELGMAFQLVDDLLGIWGDPARTGKPVYSDLRTGKKTLPVAYAMHHGGSLGRRLEELLADPDRRRAHPERAAELIEAAGGRAWATDEARSRVERAATSLDGAALEPIAVAQLRELAEFVITREA